MAPPKQPRHPRQANVGSTDRGRYNTASRLANTGTTPTTNDGEADDSVSATGPASTQSSVLNNPATSRLFPHLGESATYGTKRPNSDQQDDDDDGEADDRVDEQDGESRAQPQRSRDTVRQNIIDKDKGYFRKQQAQKDKRDKKAATEAAAAAAATAAADAAKAAVNSEVDGDEIVVAAGRSQKQSASKQTKAPVKPDGGEDETQIASMPAKKEPATKRGKGKAPAPIDRDDTMGSDGETAAAGKEAIASKQGASEAPKSSTAGPSIQAGNLVKGIQASEKPERKRSHHKQGKPKYDSAPSDSEPDPGHDTLRKLRNTVDRHAFWCPFVRFNKRLENMHRRMKKVEGMLDTKSSSGGDENGKAKTSKDLGARKAQSTAGESKGSGERDDSKNGDEKEGVEDEEGNPEEKDEENEEQEEGDSGNHEHDDKPDEDQSNNNNNDDDDADADPAEDDSGKKSSKAKAPSKSRMSTTKKTAAKAHSTSKKSAALPADITEAAYIMADDEDDTEFPRAELVALNDLDPTESDDSDAFSVSHISAGIKHGDALLEKTIRNSLDTPEQEKEARKKHNGNGPRCKFPRAASHFSDQSFLPNESVDDEEEISLTDVAFDASVKAHEREMEKTKKRKAAGEEPEFKPADKKRRTSRQSGLIQK